MEINGYILKCTDWYCAYAKRSLQTSLNNYDYSIMIGKLLSTLLINSVPIAGRTSRESFCGLASCICLLSAADTPLPHLRIATYMGFRKTAL